MTISHNTAITSQGLARLLSTFKGKPRIACLLSSWLDEFQAAEDALWDVFTARLLTAQLKSYADTMNALDPFAYWHLDVGVNNGDTMPDASGHGQDGLINLDAGHGNVVLHPDGLIGFGKAAVGKNGPDTDSASTVERSSATGIGQSSAFTIVVWNKLLDFDGAAGVSFGTAADNYMFFAATGLVCRIGGTNVLTPAGAFTVGTPGFHVFTYDGATAKYYKDGALYAHASFAASLPFTWNGKTLIAGLEGCVSDEFAMCSHAITADDVAALHEAGNGVQLADLLDKLGALVGQKRNGMSSQEYKSFILARILANKSSGKREQLIAVLSAILNGQPTPPTTGIICNESAACVELEAFGVTANQSIIWRDFLNRAKAAGVRMLSSTNADDFTHSLITADHGGGFTPTVSQSTSNHGGTTRGTTNNVNG